MVSPPITPSSLSPPPDHHRGENFGTGIGSDHPDEPRIREFIGGHRFLNWSPAVHREFVELLRVSGGWERIPELIDLGVKRGVGNPVKYAIGIIGGESKQEGAKAGRNSKNSRSTITAGREIQP